MRRKYWTAVTVTIIFLMYPVLTSAGTDLLVGPGTIRPNVPLTPGKSYTLPTHKVTNNSFSALQLSVSVSELRDEERELPSAEWFSIEPAAFTVQARSEEEVQVEVNLPEDAPPGQYKVWFLFDAMPVRGEGLVTTAAINVSLEFDVRDIGQARNSTGEGQGGAASQDRIPWALIALFLVAAAIALTGWLIYRQQNTDAW